MVNDILANPLVLEKFFPFSKTATRGLLLSHVSVALPFIWADSERYLVLELVGVLVLLLVQVDEVVCDALLAARLHVPADLEGVAGYVADLDVLRNRKLLHLGDAAVLGFTA